MSIYYGLIALILIEWVIKKILDSKFNAKNLSSNFFYKFFLDYNVLVFVYMVLICSLRSYSVGCDLQEYERIFYEINDLAFIQLFEHPLEFLYVLLNWILGHIFYDFRVFVVAISILIYGLFIFVINIRSEDKQLSLFLFISLGLFFQSMHWFRQFIALIILWLSLKYVFTNQFWKFLLCVILASFFHYTAFSFIIIYFLHKFISINMVSLSLLLILTAIVILFTPEIVKLFSIITQKDYYEIYFVGETFKSEIGVSSILYLVCQLLLFLYLWSNFKNIKKSSTAYSLYLKMFYIAVALKLISFFTISPTFVARLVSYYFMSLCFIIPIFLNNQKNKFFKIMIYSALLLVGIAFFTIFARNSYNVLPYKFLWE